MLQSYYRCLKIACRYSVARAFAHFGNHGGSQILINIFLIFSHTLILSHQYLPNSIVRLTRSIVACHCPPPLPIGKQLQEPIVAEFIIILDICSDRKRRDPRRPHCKRIMRIYMPPTRIRPTKTMDHRR